jgi:hypothetical protein
MSKPKWAPRGGKWAPVKQGFWDVWHANKVLVTILSDGTRRGFDYEMKCKPTKRKF